MIDNENEMSNKRVIIIIFTPCEVWTYICEVCCLYFYCK